MMLRRLLQLRKIPSRITLGNFSSVSESNPTTTRPPPRKGRQAIRRLLKLLPNSSHNAPDPNLLLALDALRTSPHTIPASAAAALISAAGDPLLAFDFYRFLKSSKPHFTPDSSLFTSLIETQLQSRSPHRFRIQSYLSEMRKLGLRFSRGELRSLLAPVLPQNPQLALSFIDESVELLGPSSGFYAEAVSLLAENSLVDEAIRVSDKARTVVRHHGPQFYSSLMGLYEVRGDAKSAMEAFVEMGNRGVSLDEGIYRILLRILCRAGWMKLCSVILQDMRKKAGFLPDEELGLNLMRGFLKKGMVSESGLLFADGILNKKESFSAFAKAMAEMRMPLEAFELLKTAGEPNFYASALLYECGNQGLVKEAEKIFAEIKSRTEIADSVYPPMIYVYSKAGLRGSAERVWDEMKAVGGFNEQACLLLMTMYGEIGLLDDALKVFEEWEQSGACLNSEAYVVLIKVLVESGEVDEARRRLSEMGNRGFSPSRNICSLVIENYRRDGRLNHAQALLKEFQMDSDAIVQR